MIIKYIIWLNRTERAEEERRRRKEGCRGRACDNLTRDRSTETSLFYHLCNFSFIYK